MFYEPLQENRAGFGVAVLGYLDNWGYPDCESFELFKMDTRQFVPRFWYDGVVLIIRFEINWKDRARGTLIPKNGYPHSPV